MRVEPRDGGTFAHRVADDDDCRRSKLGAFNFCDHRFKRRNERLLRGSRSLAHDSNRGFTRESVALQLRDDARQISHRHEQDERLMRIGEPSKI